MIILHEKTEGTSQRILPKYCSLFSFSSRSSQGFPDFFFEPGNYAFHVQTFSKSLKVDTVSSNMLARLDAAGYDLEMLIGCHKEAPKAQPHSAFIFETLETAAQL